MVWIIGGISLFSLKIDSGFEQYIPGGVQNRLNIEHLDSIFGGNEKVMVILSVDSGTITSSTFKRLSALEKDLAALEGVESCFSALNAIDIKHNGEYVSFDPIINLNENSSIESPKLLSLLKSNIFSQRFIADDLKATALILTKETGITDARIIDEINSVVNDHPGPEKVNIGGLAYVRNSVKSYIIKDLKILLPAALLLMVLMLLVAFREWKGVTIPFMVVIISIVTAFSVMVIMGWKISLMTVLMPIMLIAIANDYSIHLINLYQEKFRYSTIKNMSQIAIDVYRELRKPILITALTTIGGVLGLLSHKMPPAFQLGILVALGITVALILSLYFVPVLLSFSKPKIKERHRVRRQAPIDRILNRFSTGIVKHPKGIILAFIVTSLLGGGGILFLKVDTNVEEYFAGNSTTKQSINLVNNKFGGSQYISVLFQGDILSPDFLQKLNNYTTQISSIKAVGHVISPTTYLKEFSKGMNKPNDAGYNQLPVHSFEAEQYLTIMEISGFSEQIAQLIDPTHNNLRLLVSMRDGSNQTGKEVLKALKTITKDDPELICIAGPGLSKIEIADMVIAGQITSLFAAIIIIFVLLSIVFRSLTAGLYGILPLGLTSLFLFGIMGYFSIPLDIVTALLSSVMIGVGVDYTIHFLWRYKVEFNESGNIALAINNTLKTAGRGIVFNAFSVIVGFSALIISGFAPLRFFGVLIVISISACLISALLLIPAMILINHPKFLEKNRRS